MAGRMDGKKAVVVGAGQLPSKLTGIGRAISELFAREGAEVCVVDYFLDRAEATVKAIVDAGGQAHAIQADVAAPGDCARLIDEAHRTMGRIDALVNNVATEEGDSDPLTLEVEGWQRVMDVNYRAMWLTCQAVIPLMQEQGGGTIVSTSSAGSRTGWREPVRLRTVESRGGRHDAQTGHGVCSVGNSLHFGAAGLGGDAALDGWPDPSGGGGERGPGRGVGSPF